MASGLQTSEAFIREGAIVIAACVYAILAALYYLEKTGVGQEIKTNLLSSAIAFQMQDHLLFRIWV